MGCPISLDFFCEKQIIVVMCILLKKMDVPIIEYSLFWESMAVFL